MPKSPDPRKPIPVKVTWIKKVPRKRNAKREELQAVAKKIGAHPKKWALIRAYPPTDQGYKSADARATGYRAKDSAFAQVGVFQFSIRYDPQYQGDYKGKVGRERGAWLLIGRCMQRHPDPPEDYEANGYEFTDDPEEAVSNTNAKPEDGEGSTEEGDLSAE